MDPKAFTKKGILGIGVDIVEIKRMQSLLKFSNNQLERFFSAQEIFYCRSVEQCAAERLAVRFAAKEAFLKALSTITKNSYSLLKLARLIEVEKHQIGAPILTIDWATLNKTFPGYLSKKPIEAKVSLSHTKTLGIAFVVLSLK